MPLPLPTEIVVWILKSSVAFPDVMDTSAPHYAIYSNDFLPLNDIKSSIRSLSLLALVCKQWNTICTPILYQCLVVEDTTALRGTRQARLLSPPPSNPFHLDNDPGGTRTSHAILWQGLRRLRYPNFGTLTAQAIPVPESRCPFQPSRASHPA